MLLSTFVFRYMESSTQLMSGDNEHDETLRLNYLTQHFSQLTQCNEHPKLDGTQVASNFHASDVPPNLSSNTLDQMSQFKLLDPNVSRTKGRWKGKEIVDGSVEEDDDHEVSQEDDTEDDD
ncbi:hypothetical protein Dimus_036105 [Dionaea muscipula]